MCGSILGPVLPVPAPTLRFFHGPPEVKRHNKCSENCSRVSLASKPPVLPFGTPIYLCVTFSP